MTAALVALVLATSAGSADVRLTVRYDPGPGAATRATLTCRGAHASGTGYLRRVAAAACRRARHLPPRPSGRQVCTEIFGGPQTARLTGRVGSRRVARTLTRVNGCKIAEWDATVPLVPRAR